MDLLFRIALLALGYFYPAYKCFKAIDLGKPKSEQLHVWCQYWIIIAIFTGFERVADTFISWLPFYSGAKLAFVVYLWHPDTKGTEYIYQTFVKRYMSEHTQSADSNLALVRDEAVRVFTILSDRLMYYVHWKLAGVLHQNAVPLPNAASQDGLHFRPSVSSAFSKMRPHQFSVQQPLVTQSASWPPREQYQWQPKASSYPVRAVSDFPLGSSHARPTQLSSHPTLPSQATAKAPNFGQATKLSAASSIAYPNHEETDFELVHSNEVPIPEPSEPSKGKTDVKGARSRWWLW